MGKIRLTERQVAMIQKETTTLNQKKVLKINESQYNRIFKGEIKVSLNTISKNIIKEGDIKSELKPLEFAQELIVFIKDVVANPKKVPFSTYWDGLGLSRKELFSMVKKEGLLTMMVDESDVKSYKTKKLGLRKGIKELCKKIMENQLTEDGGYPAGAEFDPRAIYNDNKSSFGSEDSLGASKGEKAKNPVFKDVYFNDREDDLMIFKNGVNLYAFIGSTVSEENYKDFIDIDGIIDFDAIFNYVNVSYSEKTIKVFSDDVEGLRNGQLVKIGPLVKGKLISWYGSDNNLIELLNQLPETTGASSSGAFVGGMSSDPIKREGGTSPTDSIKGITENGINKKYTHYAIFKSNNKIADGWEYNGLDNEDIKEYSKYDLKDNFPDNKPSDFLIVNKKSMGKKGIDPQDSNNWFKFGMDETTSTTSVGGDSGTFAYDAPAGDGSNFWNTGNKLNKKSIGENVSIGQVYMNGSGRARIDKLIGNNSITVTRWGDAPKSSINIGIEQLKGWTLLEGKKILKISESQLKRIIKSDKPIK